MIRLTLDASVVCKWFLQDAADEPHLAKADRVLRDVIGGAILLVQPPHWRAEVLSTVVRRRPHHIRPALASLNALALEIVDTEAIYQLGMELARETGTHLFDTLYHAVALDEPDGCLVTADARYHEAAARFGCIIRLEDYEPGVGEPTLDYRGITRRALEAQAHQLR